MSTNRPANNDGGLMGEVKMARVNRTTGFFLILGVIALLGTVTGISVMQNGGGGSGTATDHAPGNVIHASGNFDVDGGLSNLVPRLPGKVKAILVKETEVVKAGQPLVQIDDQILRDKLKIAEQAVIKSRAQLNDAKEAADKLVKESELKIQQQQNAVEIAKIVYEGAQKKLKRANDLKANKLSADADAMVEEAEMAVLMAKKNMLAAQEGLANLQSINRKVSFSGQEEAIKEAELTVKAAKEELESFVIRAPSDGEILRINYQLGGSAPLPMGDPNASQALIFCPSADLLVRAEIDQEWALMVKPGQKATITCQSGNREYTWTGTVERAANYMQRRRSRAMDPSSFSDSNTRECVIRVNPKAENPILHNMPVRVQIHLDN